MKVVPLNDDLLNKVEVPSKPSEITILFSETSSRLLEAYEIQPLKVVVFLQQLLRVYKTSPESFQLALQVLSGSGEEKKTYKAISEKQGKSRQYVHKQRQRELKKLNERFPQVAEILKKSLWTNK